MNHSLEGGWLEQRELGVGGGQRRQREEYHVGPWKGLVRHFGLPWWLSSKESVCNAGDKGLIPGLGRFLWSRAWQPTGDPLEEEMATHSSILAGKIPRTEDSDGLQVYRVTKSQILLSDREQHTGPLRALAEE